VSVYSREQDNNNLRKFNGIVVGLARAYLRHKEESTCALFNMGMWPQACFVTLQKQMWPACLWAEHLWSRESSCVNISPFPSTET